MKITKVHPESLGAEIGIQPANRLMRINGKRVQDELDYKFRITEETLILDFEIDGKIEQVEVEKEYDDDLGVEFEEMKIRSCANDCVFCFVDQNPPNMRDGMYFRDGDYRMSYLYGHYITMTNMGQNELNRIVEQKLSPLYISVHVTDPELRQKLFLYKRDDGLLDKLTFLTENNIELHSQIVLMPSVNDGKYLEGTLKDLYRFFPTLGSCSIVPVGLTGHREGLMQLESVDRAYAENLIKKLPSLRDNFPGKDSAFVLLSDEWYILAEKDFPQTEEYGDFDLAENGVGQVRSFLNKFEEELASFPETIPTRTHISIATGTLVQSIFKEKVLPKLNKIKNLSVDLIPIVNNFYGNSVTISGLLTGTDIITQLSPLELGDAVWMSHRILNDEGTKTLDDLSIEDISTALKTPLLISNDSFSELIGTLNHG